MATSTTITNEDLDLFYEIATSIHAIRDLNDMLRHVMGKIKAVFHVEGASIAVHDAENREFYFIRTVEEGKNKDPAHMSRMRFADHLGAAGWVLRHNQSLIIPDVSGDERFYRGMDNQEQFVTRCMICVPLRTRKGSVLGVLYVLNKHKGVFSESDQHLLEILSGPIAIAIENARLYGELRRQASVLEQENRLLKTQVQERYNRQGVIGRSPAMRQLFALLDKVLDTTTTVLIQGETGTGKELIAKVIHYNGPLKDKSMVIENCGALAENLLESELFGHVKGAFTGAVADKKGLFEVAHGGTVFLDEIGEMSPAMQVKLLRVLQEGQIRPVGGMHSKKIQVRLLAATNRDLAAEMKAGRFRQDLYYRVSVFPITLPPLRDRREDIPLLADHFVKQAAERLKRPKARFAAHAMELITRYHWPGNIRELENEIERALTLAGQQRMIEVAHLSEKLHAHPAEPVTTDLMSGSLHEVIQRIERQMVMEALRKTRGNRSKAARLLGLTRQGLLNKIGRYRIEL